MEWCQYKRICCVYGLCIALQKVLPSYNDISCEGYAMISHFEISLQPTQKIVSW